MMDYSITILTFNSERYIRKCLVSLVESFNDLSARYEIFVIDNGSKDKSKEITRDVISEYSANISLIEFDHNTGTTFSRNQGLSKSAGEFIIVMDSDAYANPDAIKNVFEKKPRMWPGGSKVDISRWSFSNEYRCLSYLCS